MIPNPEFKASHYSTLNISETAHGSEVVTMEYQQQLTQQTHRRNFE